MAQLKLLEVSASTLIEVVVAMVIILIAFVFATGIFSNILNSAPNLRQAYTSGVVDSLMSNSHVSSLENDVFVHDGITFSRNINQFSGYSDLLIITIQVNDHQKPVATYSRVIKINENGK